MKILHLSYTYFPYPAGGTEVYIHSLAKHLGRGNHESVITFPSSNNQEYVYEGITVKPFKTDNSLNLHYRYFHDIDFTAESDLTNIVDNVKPDIVHFHNPTITFMRSLGKIANKRNIPTVFTCQVASFTCMRDSLFRWGDESCDGRIDVHTCPACVLNKHGVNKTVAGMFYKLPGVTDKIASALNLKGGIWTAIRLEEIVEQTKRHIQELTDQLDRIIVVNQWNYDVFLTNGFPEDKLTIVKPGIDTGSYSEQVNENNISRGDTVRMAFLGRMEHNKGIDVLLKALEKIKSKNFTLDIYGIPQNQDRYERYVQQLAEDLDGVNLLIPVKNEEVINMLGNYDYLIVPSQCFEGVPLVMLEAFAAGIPVIGSDVGAINEHIQHGHNGLLVRHNSVEQWTETIRSVIDDTSIHSRLKINVTPPRSMEEVAEDMGRIYNQLI